MSGSRSSHRRMLLARDILFPCPRIMVITTDGDRCLPCGTFHRLLVNTTELRLRHGTNKDKPDSSMFWKFCSSHPISSPTLGNFWSPFLVGTIRGPSRTHQLASHLPIPNLSPLSTHATRSFDKLSSFYRFAWHPQTHTFTALFDMPPPNAPPKPLSPHYMLHEVRMLHL
jgi:hypothetical protein